MIPTHDYSHLCERRALHPFTLPLSTPSPPLFIFPPITHLWSLWRRLLQIWDFLAGPGRVSCWRRASVVTRPRLFNPPARPGCSIARRRGAAALPLRVSETAPPPDEEVPHCPCGLASLARRCVAAGAPTPCPGTRGFTHPTPPLPPRPPRLPTPA